MRKIPNINWIEWLIGFCDADANFQVFPKKRYYLKKDGNVSNFYNIGYGFHISLSIKDLDLLKAIQNNLNGIGHSYVYKNRDEARLSITKTEELTWLILNIFDHAQLITQHQRERYARFRLGVLNNFNRVDSLDEYNKFIETSYIYAAIDPNYFKSVAFDNWIIGFINGEGSFNIHSKKKHLIFYIEHTDRNSLVYIKNRFSLSPSITYREARSDRRQPTYVLFISSKKDTKNIMEFFNSNHLSPLAGNKYDQFKTWIAWYEQGLA